MSCIRPILMRNPAYDALIRDRLFHVKCCGGSESDDYYTSRELLESLTEPYILVPCRRCPECLKMRSMEWRSRLLREFDYNRSLGKRCLFVTLTYSPDFIADARLTYKRDIAILFDSLRSKFRRSIRHFCIAELGEKNGRFHVHCLFFDPPPELAPDSHFHRSKNGALMGSNSILFDRWRKGIVDVGYVKEASGITYVAGYLSKMKPDKNGAYFFSPIVSSNGLGFRNFSVDELNSIVSSIRLNIRPTFTVFGSSYTYPSCILRKFVNMFDRIQLRINNALTNYSKGGLLSVNGIRFNNLPVFEHYCNIIYSNIPLFRVGGPQFLRDPFPDGSFSVPIHDPNFTPF